MRRGIPDEARRFSLVAEQRSDEARFLLEGHRNTAAIYLAGYAVECILKALWLSRVPARRRAKQVEAFRGGKAHDLEWLKAQYKKKGGEDFPPLIAKAFARVNAWSTDLRYNPGTTKEREAEGFVGAVEEIIKWAKERL
jgi:HEPN domain-containing protein